MATDVSQLLLDRASAMAEHDGAPVSPVYLFGAASQLQGELLSARNAAVTRLAASAPVQSVMAVAPIAADTTPVEPIVAPVIEPVSAARADSKRSATAAAAAPGPAPTEEVAS